MSISMSVVMPTDDQMWHIRGAAVGIDCRKPSQPRPKNINHKRVEGSPWSGARTVAERSSLTSPPAHLVQLAKQVHGTAGRRIGPVTHETGPHDDAVEQGVEPQ